MAEEESGASHLAVKDDGSEWTSSRRVGRRAPTAINRDENKPSITSYELRVNTQPTAEVVENTSEANGEKLRETGRGRSGSEHSDQLEEPVIPVTVLPSMEAETKPQSRSNSGFVPAEHVAGRDEGEDTEDDIALLEYLSGTESDYYELDRASRKVEDAEVMSSSPRSNDESLGTPGSPEKLLVVDDHDGFGQSPIRYMTVTRRKMAHAQEAPRQASTRVVESTPSSTDTGESGNIEAKPAVTVPHRTRAAQESDSEWVPCETEDGLIYYYNQRTQESQWTIPTSSGARTYTTEELFAAVSEEELSETDARQLSKLGNEQAAALLVYYGAKLDARAIRDDATPLILACRAESEGIVKLLIESKASLSARDSNGNTALHVAAQSDNEGLVMLILRGCDHTLLSQKNNEGETALHIAAKLGYFGIARSLLAYGASVKDEDSQGRTPLILSILENHVEPSGAERDALTVLHSYLFQSLPNHSAPEAQTIFQLVEEVRGQIGALNASLQASNGREAHYRVQLEEMSSNLAASGEELKQERASHEENQNQLAVRELELEASRVSHRALSSRCELLESIARNAQEKLGRERLEHTRYEESMQERLRHSLQENANVIESCRQLQASWSERQQQYDHRLGLRDSQGFYEISEGLAHLSSAQESLEDNYHLLETEASTSVASGNQPRERTSSDYHYHQQQLRRSFEQYPYENAPKLLDAPPPLLEDNDEAREPTDTLTPPISPARVGAVWNRFFENVGHASEPRGASDSKSHGAPTLEAGQPPMSYPSSSLVFDAVRKNDLRKLQEVLLRGVSPNQRDVAEKGTPLHLACELGDLDSVMLLSEFTADLEARDEAGNTPLLAACFQGNFECVKFLLQSAVSLQAANENGDSALHLAAWDGSISCVIILLNYGADPMATNRFGLTALSNMKTRSPMRHKFDDMPEDHPMRRTLVILEEAERHRLQQAIEDQSTSTEDANEHHTPSPKQKVSEKLSKRHSWTQWFLGFRGASLNGAASKSAKNTSNALSEHKADSDDGDDLATYEESSLTLSETQHKPLTPPPEIQEVLRRAKAGQISSVYETHSSDAPTYSIVQQDFSKQFSLAPSLRNSSKPHPPAAPTKLRARYVDTFNSP
ncbi:hypothetical protein PInf_015887 [Phytophthora infestans]|nr:hypothetical protein PInf_015887 [Phytophthora infestans]